MSWAERDQQITSVASMHPEILRRLEYVGDCMSNYVDQNLNTGESVVYRTRLHWAVFIWPSLFALFMLFPGVARLSDGIGLIFLVIGFTPAGIAYLRRMCAEFAVTDRRVILKWGVFQTRTAEMFLNKVESIGVTQNPLGKMLGYGTIIVRGTGGTPEPFVKVDHPLEFRRQVQTQVEKSEKSNALGQAVGKLT